jgi:hypothetical protein
MSPVAASPAAAAPIRPGIPVIAPAARAGPPGPPRPPRPAVTNESSKVMVDLGPESDDTQGEAPDKIEREWFDKQ